MQKPCVLTLNSQKGLLTDEKDMIMYTLAHVISGLSNNSSLFDEFYGLKTEASYSTDVDNIANKLTNVLTRALRAISSKVTVDVSHKRLKNGDVTFRIAVTDPNSNVLINQKLSIKDKKFVFNL